MRRYHAPDPWLILATLFLVGFGLLMVSSASVVESYQATGSNTYYFFRQLVFALIGLVIWFFIQRFDYHRFRPVATIGLGLSIALLLLVFIPGLGFSAGGSRRWIGAGDLTLQVTEPLKIALIIYLAYWFERKGSRMRGLYSTFIPFVILMGAIGALVMAEPDMGTAIVVSGIALALYFAAGANLSHVLTIIVGGVALVWALIKAAPYRLARLLTFLNPERDPLGAGYHITQALIALGSGGILGLGFGHSRQKFDFLPEASSDSIFAVIGEELGLIGVLLLVILPLSIVVWRGLKVAKTAPDVFGRLIALGITVWIGLQAVINIGAISGLLPLTGVPLPFVSQGGTSLMFVMIASGVLLNVSRQTTQDKSDEDPFSWWWNIWARFTGAIDRAGNPKKRA
ncbi:putative lipid II flippase FtsW [Patescibacteria group bacterium]|nr:putative lipid II flippase FtsW [Patescibacteria group bacterium]